MAAQSNKKPDNVSIKGSAGSLLIRLRDDSQLFASLLEELESRLTEGEKFFRGARASVELGKRELETAELESLLPILSRYGVELEHIVSGSQVTRSAARQLGLIFKLPTNQNTHVAPSERHESGGLLFDSAEALLVRRTLRSGQVVQHHSDVIVLGDVNPGAEIAAGGSIIVWGALRGVAQAGVNEENSDSSGAVVCALQLNPSRLSIGRLMSRSPEGGVASILPEMALVRDGTIVVEVWSPGRKK